MSLVTCPSCGTRLEIAADDVGYKMQCGGCKGVFEAPNETANWSSSDDLPPSRREDSTADGLNFQGNTGRQPNKGLGIASMTLGIIAWVSLVVGALGITMGLSGFVLILFGAATATICAILSLIFGLMALKTEGRGKGIAGLVFSGITLLIILILTGIVLWAMGVFGPTSRPLPPGPATREASPKDINKNKD